MARNLDIYVRRGTETDPKTGATKNRYSGTATLTNGTVPIKDYLPMRADMRAKFNIDGSIVRLPEIVLLHRRRAVEGDRRT